jgi:hypothetical protein
MNSNLGLLEIVRRTRRGGLAETGRRAVRRLYNRLDAGSLDFPLLEEDIVDSTRMRDVAAGSAAVHESPAMTIGWVCTPPGPGSGGHTTLFRMVAGMAARGHRCILYLYDRHGGDHDRHAQVIRDHWPQLAVEIRDATDGIRDVDACVASSWETAHVLASRIQGPASLLYFIQDFEPFFYPRGSLQALAEDSYRFGFTNIALGDMVARELMSRDIGCIVAPFGCDTEVYSLSNEGSRSGVVFYAKPGVDRRGYLLGKRALEEFHRRHPEQSIHLFGDAAGNWQVPVLRHKRLTPRELNALYNKTLAGLAMSFTNISLVAEEMLAAGTIPVVNDSQYARADLPNEHVEWAVPTAGGIADALSLVVEDGECASRSLRAAESVRQGWGPAQEVVAAAIVEATRTSDATPRQTQA